MERALCRIIEWCNSNFININIDKTKFCIYGTKTRVNALEINTIGQQGNEITRCHHYCYLGVKLDECLKDRARWFSVELGKLQYLQN